MRIDIESARRLGAAMISRVRIADDYRVAFGTPEGKRVLRDLIKRAGVLAPAAVAGDPGMTHFRDGRASVVKDIMKVLSLDEDDLLDLARQLDEDEATRRRELVQG